MQSKDNFSVTSNQRPDSKNRLSRFARNGFSYLMPSGVVSSAGRPQGISVYMRVKDERDWIAASVASVKGIADEIVIVDNGSSDGTYEILQEIARAEKGFIKLTKKPELHHCDLSNFAMEQTSFRWVFRWDGDMVAHTDGEHPISQLRARILALNPRRYYLVYLRHINLSGDLFHQDPQEMVHIEEYVHTFSEAARFIHPGRFEAVKFPFYYKPLFWYEPYVFHVNVKPARRMLLRYFWEEWMELKDYIRYPRLEDYVFAKIETEFGTTSMEEAQRRCVNKMLQRHIHFNTEQFGPYPEKLRPLLEQTSYRIQYQDGRISGRTEPENRT
jgi:glycosyltransferase involved in cell wall biosynthesis